MVLREFNLLAMPSVSPALREAIRSSFDKSTPLFSSDFAHIFIMVLDKNNFNFHMDWLI